MNLTFRPIRENQTYPYLRKYSAADVNQDGVINATDVQLVINRVLGIEVGYDADINGDGTVDQADRDLLDADMGRTQLWP